jgi:hypothetical protein
VGRFQAAVDRMNAALDKTFGEPATVTNANVTDQPITVIYSAPYIRAGVAGLAVEQPDHLMAILAAYVAAYGIGHGSTITRGGVAYAVYSERPDGMPDGFIEFVVRPT